MLRAVLFLSVDTWRFSMRRFALSVACVLSLGLICLGSMSQAQFGSLNATQISQLSESRIQLSRVSAEIESIKTQQTQTHHLVKVRARALYRLRRAGMLPVAGGFRALMSHVSRVERLQRIVKKDLDAVHFQREQLEALQVEQSRIKREQGEAGFQHSAGFELPAATATEPDPYAPQLPSAPIMPAPAAMNPSAFASLRGRLALPVMSATEIREAMGEDGPGLRMDAPVGTLVRAAADGRVVYSETYGSHGRVVIVDHGAGFFSVYGGMVRTSARIGDAVAREGALGSAGPQGLFFQIRQGTRALDARSWLGI